MRLLYKIPTLLFVFAPGNLILVWALFLMGISLWTKHNRLRGYSIRLMIAVDQMFNTVLGGSEDETISSRAAKRQDEKLWAKVLCWALNKVDPGHCEKSIEMDEG